MGGGDGWAPPHALGGGVTGGVGRLTLIAFFASRRSRRELRPLSSHRTWMAGVLSRPFRRFDRVLHAETGAWGRTRKERSR